MKADAGMSAAGGWVHGRPGSLFAFGGQARPGLVMTRPDGIAAAGSRVFPLPLSLAAIVPAGASGAQARACRMRALWFRFGS